MSSKRKGNSSERKSRDNKVNKQVNFGDVKGNRPPEEEEIPVPVDRTEDDKEEEEDFDANEDFSGGYKLESFNMKEEREEGSFNEAGSYLERKYLSKKNDNNRAFLRGEKVKRTTKRAVLDDENENEDEEDAWLEEYDEQVERYAASGKNIPTYTPKQPAEEMDDAAPAPINQTEERQTLLQYMQPGESVASALRRLGKDKKPKPKGQKGKQTEGPPDPFDTLTESADKLLGAGYYNVYSDKREQIEADLLKVTQKGKKPAPKEMPPPPQPPAPTQPQKPKVMWEYQVEGKTYGPYSSEDMYSWKDQGYFSGESAVQVRKINEDMYAEEEPFVSSNDLDFALYVQQ